MLHAILDATFLCHAAVVDDGVPRVLPTIFGRWRDHLVLHGALANALLKAGAGTAEGDDRPTVCVTVTGGPEDGVTVEVCNPRPVGSPTGPRPPGSGLGLLGLSERTALRGGRLTHRDDGETFVLRGWVPWT